MFLYPALSPMENKINKNRVFKKNINYPSIFKITTDGKISNFVTEPFMECVEKNKLKGLACGLIWDSERDI